MPETYNFDPPHQEMGRHVKSGILNSGAVQIIKMICQFASVIIVSRLLPPSDFGLIAMTWPIYAFVTMFLDLGLNSATVQKASLNHDEANAFFWISVAVGILLTLLMLALSPLAGWYYHDPRVTPLTMAMSALMMIGAFGNQHTAILTRRMSFTALALMDVAATVGALLVSITGALTLKTYWALYFGMAAATIIPVIGAWLASKWRPSAPHFSVGIGDSLKFGMGITGFNVANFFARNMDNVLIGRFCGGEALGRYDRAYKLLLFPLQRIVYPVFNVLVPVLSRVRDEPERYNHIYLKTLSLLVLIVWPGILFAITYSHELIAVLLGPRWEGTGEILRPLAIVAFIQTINGTAGTLYISQGRSGHFAKWGLFSAITSVISFACGLPFGVVGVAAAYTIGEYLRTPLLWRYATHQGPLKASALVATLLPHAGAAVITLLSLLALSLVPSLSGITLLITAGLTAYAVFALSMLISANGRATMNLALVQGNNLLRRGEGKKKMPLPVQGQRD